MLGPLRCPESGEPLEVEGGLRGGRLQGRLRSSETGVSWPAEDGFIKLYREGGVRPKDRLLRCFYDGLPRLHDPAVQVLLPLLQGKGAAATRSEYWPLLELEAATGPLRILEVGIGTGEELVGYAELRGANRSYDATKEVHARQEVKVIDRTSAAVRSEDDLTAALSALASGARHRIIIQNPYVVLTKHAVAALEAAGKRGVHIDLLTNSPDSTDSLLTQAFFLEDWPRILARVPNMRIFTLTGEQKLHAKVATADDKVSVVGSYNLDLLSEQVNGEIAAASWSPGLARDIRKSFDADKANPAHKVVEYTIQRDEAGRPTGEGMATQLARGG
ncbi:MAG: hypothetical protein KC933_11375 [Myxococcales bacterium]|nr:hypothetical protein [Myxococcales bacterium]